MKNFTVNTKTIFRLIGLCLLMLAVFACASGGGGVASGTKVQIGEQGLAVEELPQVEADIEVFPQLGLPTEIQSIAFSPDGKIIAASSDARIIKLVEVASGREIRTLAGHSGSVNSVAFSPSGKALASGGSTTVKLWDIESGKEIRTFTGHLGSVNSVAFSSDGKTIVSGSRHGTTGSFDGTVKLWDVESGREIWSSTGHENGVVSVAFNPDGKSIACGLYNNDGILKVLDAATGMEIWTSTDSGIVESVAFSPDGKTIITGHGSNVKLWNADTGKEIWTYTAVDRSYNNNHTTSVMSVCFSPDGKTIASASYDNIIIMDVISGRAVLTLYKRSSSSHKAAVAFNPDGNTIACGYGDNIIRLLDTHNGSEIWSSSGNVKAINFIVHSPNEKTIASCSGNIVKLWNITSSREIGTIIVSHRFDTISSIAFSPEGKTLASGSNNTNDVKLWDVTSCMEIRTFTGHTRRVNSVAFSPDGKYIASLSYDSTIKLWDVTNGNEVRTLTAANLSYSSFIVFSPDGKYVAAYSYSTNTTNRVIQLWDVVSGKETRTFPTYNSRSRSVESIAFSPDGRYIAVGGFDPEETVKLWDVASGREIRTFTDGYKSVRFSPDGKLLASCSGSTVKLWDTATGIETKSIISDFSGTICSLAFSPDGKYIVTGSEDGTTRIWDVATGKELAAFISFSGVDTQLATVTRGLTVETETAATTNDGEWLAITPDGYYQASPRGDRYLNVRVGNTVSGIDSYRSVFYNPDVVQARLRGMPDPASKANVSIQQAAAFLPPTVTIQSPANFSTTNTATASLSVAIADQNQPIQSVKVFINGRSVGRNELAATVTGSQKTVNLTLPLELDPGPNRIEVVAFNGYSDTRRYVDVTWNAPAGTRQTLPNLWVLAVGVNAYDNAGTSRLAGHGNLNFCAADAKSLIDTLKTQEGRRYAKVNSLLIADGEAQAPTAAAIREGIKFLDHAGERDVALLFLAGHGITAQEGKFFFMPKDAVLTGNLAGGQLTDKNVDASRAISGDEMTSVLEGPGNRLLFIDACNSGGVDNDRMIRALMESNALVFAASQGDRPSYESREWGGGHGAFTYTIMNALSGRSPGALAGNNVSVLSMSGFVSIEVPKLTSRERYPQQPKAYSLGSADFPMAVVR